LKKKSHISRSSRHQSRRLRARRSIRRRPIFLKVLKFFAKPSCSTKKRNPEPAPPRPETRVPEHRVQEPRNPEPSHRNPEPFHRNPEPSHRNADMRKTEMYDSKLLRESITEITSLQELIRKKDEENANLKQQIVVLQKNQQPVPPPTPISPPKQNYTIKRDQLWHLIEEDDSIQIENLIRTAALDLSKSYSSSPLHYAISTGSTETIKLLARSCPKSILNEPDAAGYTPLLYALEKGPAEKVETIIQLLLKNNANVELGDVSDNGFTPLHAACHSGNPRLVALFLHAGADVHKCDTRLGWSTIHWGVAGGSSAVIKLLLEKGVVLQRINGLTPVQLATDLNHQHLIPLLRSNVK